MHRSSAAHACMHNGHSLLIASANSMHVRQKTWSQGVVAVALPASIIIFMHKSLLYLYYSQAFYASSSCSGGAGNLTPLLTCCCPCYLLSLRRPMLLSNVAGR